MNVTANRNVIHTGDNFPDYYRKDMPMYAPLVGSWVKVCQNSGRVLVGKLELTDCSSSYLRPSLVNESVGDGDSYRLEAESPTPVNNYQVLDMQPVTEGYIEKILKLGNNQLKLDFKGEK